MLFAQGHHSVWDTGRRYAEMSNKQRAWVIWSLDTLDASRDEWLGGLRCEINKISR